MSVCLFAEVACLNFVFLPSKKKKLWSNGHSFSLETRAFNVAFTHSIPSVSMVELTVEKIKFKRISKISRKSIFRRIENFSQCCTTK